MKVIKEDKELRNVTLRLSETLMKQIDRVASENKISRQRLIEAILSQSISDKSFVLRLS